VNHGRWFRLVALAAVASLVFVACGGDDGGNGGEEGDGESTAQERPVGEYVSDFCQSMVDWQNEVQSLSTEFQSGVTQNTDLEPEQKKEELEGYLEDLKGATETFISDVEDAGFPDVTGGEQISENFLSGFRQLTGAIETVQEQSDDVDTSSQEAYNSSAQELVGQIQSSFQAIGDGLQQIESANIDQAFQDAEECSQIQT
jgi:hypothetical protein